VVTKCFRSPGSSARHRSPCFLLPYAPRVYKRRHLTCTAAFSPHAKGTKLSIPTKQGQPDEIWIISFFFPTFLVVAAAYTAAGWRDLDVPVSCDLLREFE